MLRKLIIGLDRWRYIVICIKSKVRQPKSDWHRFVLKAQLSSSRNVRCNMELSKLVRFFHHGMILFPHLENSYIHWESGYKENDLIEWKSLKLRKGKST
jgi:hypothetical protein